MADPGQDRDDRRSDRRRRPTSTSSKKLQHRLLDLQVHHLRTGGRVIIGIDGWDAAGKGGLIQRMVVGLEPQVDPCLAHRRADARGAGPPLSLALLGPPAGAGQLGDLRPHLVRPRAGRAHRGLLQQGGLEARLPRDQRVRAPARRRRRAHRQAPRPCQRGGAEAADDRAAGEARTSTTRSALEDFRNIAKRKAYLEAYDDMLEHTDTELRAMARHRHRQQGACPAEGPARSSSRQLGKGMKIPEQPLDPKIVEAAFKLWGWTPGRRTSQQETECPFGMVRFSPNYWPWPAGRSRPTFLSMMQKQQSRIFAGWWVVAGAFLCMMTGFAVAYSFAAFFGALESRVRRPPRRDLAGLLDRGLPLFLARLSGRPDRRPDRAAPPGDRRPAAGRRGPRRRRPGEQPVADLSRLRPRRRRGRRPLLCAQHRRGAALVRAPSRHRQRPRHRRHRRRHPDRRAAGARVDRRRSAGARPISCWPP